MLSDLITLVDRFLPDDADKTGQLDREGAIALAVARYSKDRPRTKVEDLTPTTSQSLPLPTAWEANFSALTSLEYPKGNVPPTLIDADRYAFYIAPGDVMSILLLDAVAVAASNVRATFTISHTLTSTTDTIPTRDREAVACYAGAVLCEQLASLYSSETDSTIQADQVQTLSKAQQYARRARDLRQRYHDDLGVAEKQAAPAGTVVPLEFNASDGRPRLTHGLRVLR